MKKTILIAAFAALFCACEEFQPVFTSDYGKPEVVETVDMEATMTILQLKNKYKVVPVSFDNDDENIISGIVTSSDSTGNFYKSIYIQDETSGIEIKLGKNNLYNEYKLGQRVYVKIKDLTIGAYYGQIQLGYKDESGSYETAYLEVQNLIDRHVFRGAIEAKVKPEVLTALPAAGNKAYQGKLVTLKGLVYANEVFALIYPDPNRPHTKENPENRVFLSDGVWNIKTWSLSEQACKKHLEAGDWDAAEVGSGATRFGLITSAVKSDGMFSDYVKEYKDKGETLTYKTMLYNNAAAQSITQYFNISGGSLGLRSSGYAKFNDVEIPADVLSGTPVDMTGVLTWYESSSPCWQLTIASLDNVVYSSNGKKLY